MAVVAIALVGTIALMAATVVAGGQLTLDAFTVGGIVLGATYGFVGWVIASRRPENAIGWVFLVVGMSQAIDPFASAYSSYGLAIAPGSLPFADVMAWVALWVWAPGFTFLVTLAVLLFPDGQPPSPRWRPLVWASFAVMGLLAIPMAIATWPLRGPALLGPTDSLTGTAVEIARGLQFVGIIAIPFVAGASIAGMVARFRRAGEIEREQLKWFTFAAIPEVGFIVASAFLTMPPFTAILIAPLLPAAATIAILRYHLFEIDRIVSRTIAYGLVTGLLVVAYAASILLIQGPLEEVTGADTIAVALSTLVVAALFQPLRVRVQRIVDGRFDRARYDAERTTTEFSERLRDQVDLPTVAEELDRTVRHAISPASVGLWLRGSGR
jgi:hypothetical protein